MTHAIGNWEIDVEYPVQCHDYVYFPSPIQNVQISRGTENLLHHRTCLPTYEHGRRA
jgi:hypothetical protein